MVQNQGVQRGEHTGLLLRPHNSSGIFLGLRKLRARYLCYIYVSPIMRTLYIAGNDVANYVPDSCPSVLLISIHESRG
jgi:hypothetical protein